MRRTVSIAGIVALLLGVAWWELRPEPRSVEIAPVLLAQEASNSLMRQKLRAAQELLESLSIGDYDRMIKHSEELIEISLEARWSQPHSLKYGDFGEDFRRSLGRLNDAALDQNIDGAALAYVQVVLTCVQCHRIVREGEEIASMETDRLMQPLFERQWMAAAQQVTAR